MHSQFVAAIGLCDAHRVVYVLGVRTVDGENRLSPEIQSAEHLVGVRLVDVKFGSLVQHIVRKVHVQIVGQHVGVRACLRSIAGAEHIHDVDGMIHVALATLLY